MSLDFIVKWLENLPLISDLFIPRKQQSRLMMMIFQIPVLTLLSFIGTDAHKKRKGMKKLPQSENLTIRKVRFPQLFLSFFTDQGKKSTLKPWNY